jgi:hypothetical protein
MVPFLLSHLHDRLQHLLSTVDIGRQFASSICLEKGMPLRLSDNMANIIAGPARCGEG